MKKIIHVDMDCFYAAVETKYRPEFRGRPLGIGGPPNSRSVLCTANYEARAFGVKAAMPSSQAVRRCPHLILIPPQFDLYRRESQAIHRIFQRFTDLIEPLSLDEAYLDVSEASAFGGSATLIAQEIRRLIDEELALPASAGIAPNKFLAKVASDWKKPNGQFTIRPSEVEDFVRELPVEKIFGVGKVTAAKLHAMEIRTCGDLQRASILNLKKLFGSRTQDLLELARGVDSRPVRASRERKSLTVEETYPRDLKSLQECLVELPELFESWEQRIQRAGLRDRIRGLVVKLRYHDFKSLTHECGFVGRPEQRHFEGLLKSAWGKREEPVRLLGLGVRLQTAEALSEGPQLSFFR